jgi:hypothetical protein
VALCIAVVKGIRTTKKEIEIWQSAMKAKLAQKNDIIEKIRNRCACALPEEYQGQAF